MNNFFFLVLVQGHQCQEFPVRKIPPLIRPLHDTSETYYFRQLPEISFFSTFKLFFIADKMEVNLDITGKYQHEKDKGMNPVITEESTEEEYER